MKNSQNEAVCQNCEHHFSLNEMVEHAGQIDYLIWVTSKIDDERLGITLKPKPLGTPGVEFGRKR